MTGIEGSISIHLYSTRKGPERVTVDSSRQVYASQAMIGKTPEQTLSLIPLIFNICGVAQSRASLLAIQQGLQIQTDTHHELARDLLVMIETAREHLFRILVDWPKLFDQPVDPSQLPALGRLINDFKQSLFVAGNAFSLDSELDVQAQALAKLINDLEHYLQQNIFGIDTASWLTIRDFDGLNAWMKGHHSIASHSLQAICDQGWNSLGFADCAHLPTLDTQALLQRFDASDSPLFIQQPDWNGKYYETTGLSRLQDQPLIALMQREFHNTLITRWVARLVELAKIPQQLSQIASQLTGSDKQSMESSQKNIGIAQVEAARGRLIHRVRIEHNSISNYQILAPTEWNFHPKGLIAQSLSHLGSKNPLQLDKQARLLINAIDPCVGYELRIH